MPESLLQPRNFLIGSEVIFSHLRLKEADRWSEAVALLKLASFQQAFPEVNDGQFLYACEAWCQAATAGTFHAFPTWRELMAPLYRCENGLANRSWGFKPGLPQYLQPSVEQLKMLPQRPESLLPAADPSHERYLAPVDWSQWTAADGKPMATQNKQLPEARD